MATIKSRRKLSALYARGVEVRFGHDAEGNPTHRIPEKGEGPFLDSDGRSEPLGEDEVAVWVQPPNPFQRDMAFRDAQASRAKALIAAKRNKESEDHLTVLAFLAEMTDETLIEYVLVNSADARRQDAMRDVLAEEEWKDITEYQDAMRSFEENNTPEDDPEYVAMMELDRKFESQILEREKTIMDSEREVLEMLGRPAVEAKALEKRSEVVGTQAFMQEYERQMFFYSVRDPDDHGQLWYESAREAAEEDDAIQSALKEALAPFISDGAEAKNSQRADLGSESSEPPSKPETSEASIPEVAIA